MNTLSLTLFSIFLICDKNSKNGIKLLKNHSVLSVCFFAQWNQAY